MTVPLITIKKIEQLTVWIIESVVSDWFIHKFIVMCQNIYWKQYNIHGMALITSCKLPAIHTVAIHHLARCIGSYPVK